MYLMDALARTLARTHARTRVCVCVFKLARAPVGADEKRGRGRDERRRREGEKRGREERERREGEKRG